MLSVLGDGKEGSWSQTHKLEPEPKEKLEPHNVPITGQAQLLQPIHDQRAEKGQGASWRSQGCFRTGVCPGSRRGLGLQAGGRGLRIKPKAIHCKGGGLGHRKPVLCN